MIENMRKYTGLMVIILVLLAAGLILTMGDFRANTGARATVTEVYGEKIDQIEYRKLGFNSINVIKTMKDPGLIGYALELIFNRPEESLDWRIRLGFPQTGSNPQEIQRFVTRRIVIAKTAAEYGIYPSLELAKKNIKEQIFVEDGNFNAAAYNEFLKEIGSAGFQEEDLVKLVAESLVYNKLKSLISSGLETPNSLTDRAIKFQQQTLDLTTITIGIDSYKKEINPTEEEIKTYWEENDFKYLTDRKISISYIAVQPEYSSPRPVAPVRAPGVTDEEFKKINDAYQAELVKWELEVEKPADKLVAATIDDLSYKIDESEGVRFEEEVKSAGFELTTTELFSANNVPEKLKLLNTKEGQSIADIIFQLKIADSLKYRIPAPIKLEGNGWFYVRYDEEVMPVTKTYEQAKELAKADYIQEKAKEAMLAEVPDIKEKLAKSIAGGVTAEEAAKIHNLEADVRPGLNDSTLTRDANGNFLPSEIQIFTNGAITDSNSFAEENVVEENKVTLVYLKNREVINTDEVASRRLRIQSQRSLTLQDSVFRAWMDDAIAQANIPPMPPQ